MARFVVGVMGQGEGASPADQALAEELGRLIAAEHWVLLTGGRDVGIMQAANRGAKTVADSLTIGILPNAQATRSPDLDLVIVTDINEARNNINVLSSDVLVACGQLGLGTASEIALGLKARKTVILLGSTDEEHAFFQRLSDEHLVRVHSARAAVKAIKDLTPTKKSAVS